MKKKKVLLQNRQSPGDILMITSAVRDLYNAHNDKFDINVITTAMPLWDNNPYLDRSINRDNCDIYIKLQVPLIHKSNTYPWHFIHGFRNYLEQQLGVTIPQGEFKVDIHLSEQQKAQPSLLKKIFDKDVRFWIINAGHKMDFTCKMWSHEKYQQVVDILKDEILFVQVGEKNDSHVHKPLKGVFNAVGLTNNPRDFVKLMYHSSGVLGGVSFAHHLATMQGRDDRIMKSRGNVCVAGGRQPMNWEAYCNQAYIHRCGQYPCCDNGGCWAARITPLKDGNQLDQKLCYLPLLNQHGQVLPMCMQSITVQQVVDAIRRYQMCFFMYRELTKTDDLKQRLQIINKYMYKQKRQHVQMLKQLYNLTEK